MLADVGWTLTMIRNVTTLLSPDLTPIQSEGPVTNTLDSQPAGIYFQ